MSFLEGSPPPTRGIPYKREDGVDMVGITPAYAGNTAIHAMAQDGEKDHPRLRGEHYKSYRTPYRLLGSPPPTRGTLLIVEFSPVRSGITPAYAGNTFKFL